MEPLVALRQNVTVQGPLFYFWLCNALFSFIYPIYYFHFIGELNSFCLLSQSILGATSTSVFAFLPFFLSVLLSCLLFFIPFHLYFFLLVFIFHLETLSKGFILFATIYKTKPPKYVVSTFFF